MHAAFAPLVAVRNIYWLHTDSWSCEIVVIESILAQIHLCVYATALNTGFDISCGVFILFHCQLQLNLCWLCHVHGWSTGLSRIFRFEPTRRWPQSLQVTFILIFGSLCLGKSVTIVRSGQHIPTLHPADVSFWSPSSAREGIPIISPSFSKLKQKRKY